MTSSTSLFVKACESGVKPVDLEGQMRAHIDILSAAHLPHRRLLMHRASCHKRPAQGIVVKRICQLPYRAQHLRLSQAHPWDLCKYRQNMAGAATFSLEMLVERNQCTRHCTIDASPFTSLRSTTSAGSKSFAAGAVLMPVIMLLRTQLKLVVKKHSFLRSAEPCTKFITARKVLKVDSTQKCSVLSD